MKNTAMPEHEQDHAQAPGGQQDHPEHVGVALDAHRASLKELFPIPPKRAARSKRNGATATVLAAALAAGLWWADPAYHSEHFVTQVGERSTVELADGSQLVLDTATELNVSWHLRSRRVALADGRVHFDVAPSGWRPFTVDAGSAQIRVVGTRFDVWRKADATRVSVYEGKVTVWRDGQEAERILLLPGQQTDVGAEDGAANAPRVRDIGADASAAWKDGRLVFLNTPLLEAISVIQRYRREPIRVLDPHIAQLTLSGVFNIDNAEQLLDLLPGVLPVRIERRADGSAELSAR